MLFHCVDSARPGDARRFTDRLACAPLTGEQLVSRAGVTVYLQRTDLGE